MPRTVDRRKAIGDRMVRVLIADGDPRIRQGLRSLLAFQPGFLVVGEAASKPEVLQRDQTVKEDLVILDLGMPEVSDGLELVRHLAGMRQRMVLAMSVRAGLRDAALQAGACAFLEKGVDMDAVIGVLLTVAAQIATNRLRPCADPSR